MMGIVRNVLSGLVIFFGLMFGPMPGAIAQGHLEKKLSLSIHQRPLTQTLADIGRKGGFFFSYNYGHVITATPRVLVQRQQ